MSVVSERRRAVARAFVRTPTGAPALALLLMLLLAAVVGAAVLGDTAERVDPAHGGEPASGAHPWGTDDLGRDILARTIVATKLALTLGLGAAGLAAVLGTAIGLLVVALGNGRAGRAGAGALDAMLSFPDILVAVFVVAILGVGARNVVIAVGIAISPTFARLTYTLAREMLSRDFVSAARVVGVGTGGLLRRHVLRNVGDSLIVAFCSAVGEALIFVSGMSFLGLGVQAPDTDWGRLLIEGLQSFYANPWAALGPAFVIAVAGLSLTLLGDAIARAMNPVLWTSAGRRGRSRA